MRAGAGREAVDHRIDLTALQGVDLDHGGLADAHAADLGFLEIGDQVDVGRRHHVHQACAGLDELADADLPVADAAGNRGAQGGVVDIDLGRSGLGLGGLHLGLRLADLGLLGGDLQLGLVDSSGIGARLGGGGIGLVDHLRGLCGGLDALGVQRLVAIGLAGGVGCGRLGAGQGGAGLVERGALFGDLALGGDDIGLAGGDGGRLLVHGRLVGRAVDLDQGLARLDHLVVGDQHLVDIALDLRRDRHLVGLQVGVVGALDEAAVHPPGEQEDSDGAQDDDAADQQAQPNGGIGQRSRFLVVGFLVLRLFWGLFWRLLRRRIGGSALRIGRVLGRRSQLVVSLVRHGGARLLIQRRTVRILP